MAAYMVQVQSNGTTDDEWAYFGPFRNRDTAERLQGQIEAALDRMPERPSDADGCQWGAWVFQLSDPRSWRDELSNLLTVQEPEEEVQW